MRLTAREHNGGPASDRTSDIAPPAASDGCNKSGVDEDLERIHDHGLDSEISDFQALMNILKTNIGTGVLALPSAFKNAGLWLGTVGVIAIGAVAVYCMHIMVISSRVISKRVGKHTLTYAETMQYSLDTSGIRTLERTAQHGKSIVNVLLIITQAGFCCVYVVFVATSIQFTVQAYADNGPGLWVYMLATTAFLLPYCMIRDLASLSPFCFFANCITLVGMVLIFWDLFSDVPSYNRLPAVGDLSCIALFFGTASFAFEGIGLILPLENHMRERERFGGWCGVLNLAMVIVVCLYTAIGFYGYIKYGENTLGSITLNLPTDRWYFLAVKPIFALALFISYNVQLYVPVKIILAWLIRWRNLETKDEKIRAEYLLRCFLVILTMGLSMAVPHLDLLISLVGALTGASLCLILPAFIHILVTYSESARRFAVLRYALDISVIVFGILGFVVGTYTSLLEIGKTF